MILLLTFIIGLVVLLLVKLTLPLLMAFLLSGPIAVVFVLMIVANLLAFITFVALSLKKSH